MKKLLLCASLALMVAAGPALAGRTCEDRPLDVSTVQMSMALAERTAKRLDQTGAQVVVLARSGQDLRHYGLRWSHLAFAYREPEGGPCRVVHKLNHCATPVAAIYRQGLGALFLDRMFPHNPPIPPPPPPVPPNPL